MDLIEPGVMEEDSRHFLKSDQISQTVSQQSNSQSQTFHCNYCVLIFKSKYFLREHVKREHGFDMDSSQGEGNSTASTTTTEPNSDLSLYNDNSGELFTCRHCVFTSSSRTVIDKHEKAYHKVPSGKGKTLKIQIQKRFLKGKLINSRGSVQQTNTVTGMWAIQCKQVGKVSSSKSMSTSNTKSIPNSSLLLKNLQTNMGSSGKISKIRVASGLPLESSQVKLPNLGGPPPHLANKPTLMSQGSLSKTDQDNDEVTEQCHTESEQQNTHCCSLCHFSAMSLMDLRNHQQQKHSYLYSMHAGPGPSSTEQQEPETSGGSLKRPLFNSATKRTNEDMMSNEDPLSPAEKKLKVDMKTRSPQSIKSKLSVSSSFNFEVSDDDLHRSFSGTEKDEDDHLVNGESSGNPTRLYFCKHCDYSHKSHRSVSTHYQRVHPYIRYNFIYILDKGDRSATFRCLDCPVEFSTSDDLKKHYMDQHPDALNVFMKRSDQLNLVYKCFACQFTTPVGRLLKVHYNKEHPSFQMNNSLMYCSYIDTHPQEPLSQSSGQTSSPRKAGIISPERSQTSRNETSNVTPTPPKASKGMDEELYHCKRCMFSNKSVIAMLVHYQKKHPKAGVTIDKIKKASFATTSKKLKEESRVSAQKIVLEPFKPQEVKSLNTSLPTSDVLQSDVERLFFCQHCSYSNVTVRGILNHQRKRHSDVKATVEHIHIYTAEVRSQSKKSVGKYTPNISFQNDFAQDKAKERVFYCQLCNYGNSTVKGILNHLKLRHGHKSTAEQILQQTAEVSEHSKITLPTVVNCPNTTLIRPDMENEVDGLFFCQYCNYGDHTVKGVLNHQRSRHSDLEATANKVLRYTAEVHGQNESESSPDASLLRSNVDKEINQLFFCQHCNYGNPSVRGVMNHQRKRHSELKTNSEQVFKHTTALRTQTAKMCTLTNSPNSSQVLPLPLMQEHLESMLFCQLCNYGNTTVRGVLIHQRKKHPKHKSCAKQIFKYTAVVHNQAVKSQLIKVDSPKSSLLKPDISQEVEDQIYFCQLCGYDNPTVRGVLNHQKLRHCDLKATADQVVQYTATVCGQSEKPQTSQPGKSQLRKLDSPKSSLLKPDVSLEENKIYFCQVCNYGNPTVRGVLNHQKLRHCDLKATADQVVQYTATVSGQSEKPQTSQPGKSQLIKVDSPKSSLLKPDISQKVEDQIYFCQLCNYGNPTVRGVLNHQKLRHLDLKATAVQVVQYTATVCGQSEKPQTSQPGKSQLRKLDSPKSSLLKPDVSQEENKIYFCQVCNYGNPTVRGVLNHQKLRHCDLKATADQVVQYTATVCGQSEKPQTSQPGKSQLRKLDSPKSSLLKPDVSQEENKIYFCQLCNYGNPTVRGVLNHQKLRHCDLKATADQVVQYTATVCGQSEKPQTSQPGLSSTTASFSESERDSQTRELKCHKCMYTTPHVYLLKRHLGNKHQLKATVISILRSAYRDGILETGYHCEWCVSVHPKANGLYQHYLEHHPWRKSSVEYITSVLHAGPKPKTKKQKAQSEHNVKHENISLQLERDPKTSPFQLPGRNDTKLYPCRACPFKSSTIPGIKSHYRAVHPWSVKEDGSVLDVISSRRLTENRQTAEADVHNTILGSFDSQKHPLDIPGQLKETISGQLPLKTSTPSKHYTCPVCSTDFNTMHGVYTHCGKKHPEFKDDHSIFANENYDEPSTSEGTPVNKCPVCPYVNSRTHGVLTHCQMKHPAYKARAENLEKEMVQFPNVEDCAINRRGRTEGGIGGYRCTMCPVIYASLKKLKIHYERDHHQIAASSMFKSAPTQSTLLKKQLLSKYRNTQSSIAQAAIFKKRKSVVFKCHLCKYCCTTKKGLDRHMSHSHNNNKTEHKVFSNKCSLCSYSTSVRKYLGVHYRRCHSHAEYNTHFVSVFKRSSQKSSPKGFPSTSSDYQASLIKDITCSLCFFQTSSEKDMFTHHMTLHPVVLDSSQPYGKPGSNFSLHSTPKTVKTNRAEKQKAVSKLFQPQSKNGIKCLPVQCRKCTKLYFNSPLLLSIHYTHFHSKDFKQDFTTLSSTSEDRSTEFYKCGYCDLEIQGKKELCSHIDHHTGVFRKLAKKEQPKTEVVMLERQELPEFQTTDELAFWNVTKVQSFALGLSPQGSPSKSVEMAEAEKGSGEVDCFQCNQCERSLMSLKGLRSHERSHAAMAAVKRLGTWQDSASSTIFDQHITYRPGTLKPFHCGLCAYRTNFIGLMKNHLLKSHAADYSDKNHTLTSSQDTESTLRPNEEASHPAEPQEVDGMTEHSQEAVLTEKPTYSEPPDVQRQLNHYRQIALGKASAPSAPQATMPTIEGLFSCEFCTFASGHIPSMRRHYLNRHNGKRLLRCKDCSYITGFRKNLDMHIIAGHFSSPTEVPKDLRCPLCLYHTKNKNNMIDHILLHREERVAPIEVRRSKLSRYLQGIVFRCHKCTFTSSSDETLRLHMVKHDDIKPYKCRLCFFDCTQLKELEEHLCKKHHVMRNHELVGQVNLEQLETRLSKVNWKENNKCGTEPGNEDEETNDRCGKKPGQEEEQDNMAEPINEGPEGGRILAEQTNVMDEKQSQMDDENIAEQIDELDEKPGQEKEENIKPSGEGQEGGENIAEQTGELHQKESQEKDNLEERNNELCEAQGQEEEERITEPLDEGHEGEENLPEHHNELCEMQGQEGEVDKEETNDKKDACQDHDMTTDRVAQDCNVHKRHSEKQENNVDAEEENQFMEWEENQGQEEMEEEEGDQYHQMPVLENEYLQEETHRSHIERQQETGIYKCNKNQEQVPIVEKVDEEKAERDENPEHEGEEDSEGNGGTSEPKDALSTPKLIPVPSNEKLFACELCGRTFIDNAELERHVMRHGM